MPGLSAAVKLAQSSTTVIVHEATRQAGGRCRSYPDAVTGLTIDNGNHLLLSGNRAALDHLRTIGTEAMMVGPDKAVFPFADLASGKRWTIEMSDGRHPLVDLRSEAARARHGGEGLSDHGAAAMGLSPMRLSATSSHARARFMTGWCSRCCWRR